MAWTQAQLDAIESAIASGVTTCSYEGKTVTYASLDVMLRVRSMIRASLGLTEPAVTVLVQHDRGYQAPYQGGDPLLSGFE
jgi:hypothetical protein